jgi:crossover junction endodeoxyribonuclease RuvC
VPIARSARSDRPAGGQSSAPASVRALGVDPGLTRTGWALVTVEGGHYRLADAGVIAPRSPLGTDDLPGRLADGYEQIVAVLEAGRPDLVALEDVFTTPRFPAAALKLAHLRGVLCLAVAKAGLPLLTLTATTVKQRLTGNGHASKEQVQRMVFGLCDVSGVRVPNDLSDAVGLAIAGLHQMRFSALAGVSRR